MLAISDPHNQRHESITQAGVVSVTTCNQSPQRDNPVATYESGGAATILAIAIFVGAIAKLIQVLVPVMMDKRK